ncbi:BrnT family toxin [Candidatus Daviesbacteria bacterium]|nr:BrnT family toxin [Candidatus Daviesbacteria bacterium]MBI3109418.1 BrnT family toxin [Candidatus Daviesbacteria bacterium]
MAKLPVPITFNWNQGNIEKNWKKHKVYYKEAEEVFFNKPLKIFKDIKHSQIEERFVALGMTNDNRRLYLVFTIREQEVRVISARDQSRKERKLYEKEKS